MCFMRSLSWSSSNSDYMSTISWSCEEKIAFNLPHTLHFCLWSRSHLSPQNWHNPLAILSLTYFLELLLVVDTLESAGCVGYVRFWVCCWCKVVIGIVLWCCDVTDQFLEYLAYEYAWISFVGENFLVISWRTSSWSLVILTSSWIEEGLWTLTDFSNSTVKPERKKFNVNSSDIAISKFWIRPSRMIFWRKQPSSPGRAGRQPPPPFSYK